MRESTVKACHHTAVFVCCLLVFLTLAYLGHRHIYQQRQQSMQSWEERAALRTTVKIELKHLTSSMHQLEMQSHNTGYKLQLLKKLARVAQERTYERKVLKEMCGLFFPCEEAKVSSRDARETALLDPIPTLARIIP